jgi:hypothetical protein
MPIDRTQLLSLWKLDALPGCVEGMELAARFLDHAGEAVDKLDKANIPAYAMSSSGLTKTLLDTVQCVQIATEPMPPKRKSHTDQLPLAWQPQVGDRVTFGTETIYLVTRASQDGSDVDLQTPGTDLFLYMVPIGDLKPVDPVRQVSPALSKQTSHPST